MIHGDLPHSTVISAVIIKFFVFHPKKAISISILVYYNHRFGIFVKIIDKYTAILWSSNPDLKMKLKIYLKYD